MRILSFGVPSQVGPSAGAAQALCTLQLSCDPAEATDSPSEKAAVVSSASENAEAGPHGLFLRGTHNMGKTTSKQALPGSGGHPRAHTKAEHLFKEIY